MTIPAGLEQAFAAHQRHLWGLCYRMTGCAADADDLVQETFARAIERPPADLDRPWRPWLVRVAANLSRDHLRRRRSRGYVGPWLPGPIEPPAWEAELADGHSTAGRYELLESVSLAFLLALEVLTPQRRAVLLLRDVFDYSVRETAEVLEMTEPAVKVALHRARKQMADYDRQRQVVDDALVARTGATLQAMFESLSAGDAERFASLLADDVQALSDGGGEFSAARVPVLGPARVTKFMWGLRKLRGQPDRSRVALVNGLPAIIAEFDGATGAQAPRAVMTIDVDPSGRVTRFYSILTSRKLQGIAPLG